MEPGGAGPARVRAVGEAVRAEAARLAADWRARDVAAWEAPSACTGWKVRDVAAHVGDGAERAVEVARAAIDGAPVPQYGSAERRQRHARFRELDGAELAARLEADLGRVFQMVEGADEAALRDTIVPLAGGAHTLAQFAEQRLNEVALHAWDVRAPSDPAAALPADAAALLLDFTVWRVPRLASPAEARGYAAVYGFELEGPGGGPIALAVRADGATATRAAPSGTDITLTMPVEAWIRLLWGRLDLTAALAAGTVRARGAREPILALVPLFPGH
jgi:uncharacterized protein (TIGR03083 family)